MSKQNRIVRNVRARGYLDGWNDDQLAARQAVKTLEEACEAVQHISGGNLSLLRLEAADLGNLAKAIFDDREGWDGVTADMAGLLAELPDLIVPPAVLGWILDTDIMEAGVQKSEADALRGVR